MNEAIPSPVKGAPMRADWAARITDVCNQMVTSGMAGTLVRDGAGAFGNAPLPVNQRNRTSNPSNDLGCFRLVMKSKDESRPDGDVKVTYLTVENRYFSIGEVSRHMDEGQEINLYDYINQGALPTGLEYTDADRPFICLKVGANIGYDGHFPEPEIVAYKDFDEVTAAQRDTNFVIRPLYKLTHAGAVAVDFRTMPHVQMVEVI